MSTGAASLFLAGLTILGLGLALAVQSSRRRTRIRSSRPCEDGPSERSSTCLGGTEEVPFHLRAITLKICPECREFVLVEARCCKYCGCEQPIGETKARAVNSDQPLALPRRH